MLSYASAQEPPKQEPPKEEPRTQEPKEEDVEYAEREYTFNPLQAEKEMKVGQFYFKKGSWRAAAMRFEEATKWNPGLAPAYLRLGEALERAGDTKAAQGAFAKYLELAPDAKEASTIKKKLKS
jgi:outer membrane protein assembly factor BamD (BamD/ComL family)